MKEEIEVKFIEVDFDEVRAKIKDLGGEQTLPMTTMRRAILDFPDKRLHDLEHAWTWVRVRDEGDRITVTLKAVSKDGSKRVNEIEYEASSFEQAVGVFKAIGMKLWSLQETRREIWELDGCELMLDEWPWIPPLVEIEGEDIESLKSVAAKLEFDWNKHEIGSSDFVYEKYYPGMKAGDTIGDIPELTFDEMPAWLVERK